MLQVWHRSCFLPSYRPTHPVITVLKVLLVDDQPDRAARVREALAGGGHEVVSTLDCSLELYERVNESAPDVIIVDIDSPDRATLESLCVISRNQPRPVVMFTHDGDPEKIREAVRAGVSAYVVDGLALERVKPIIDAAMAHFEQFEALRRKLEQTEGKLAERKLIERAKGVIMEQKHVGEDEAFRTLSKFAMDHGIKLSVAAEQIVQISKMLG